jgi:hypothetical protein
MNYRNRWNLPSLELGLTTLSAWEHTPIEANDDVLEKPRFNLSYGKELG